MIDITTRRAGAQRRPSPRRAVVLVTIVACALAGAARAHAATTNVSNTGELQNAVASAAAGDTIVLAIGTYAPDAPLDVKVNLTLVGADTAARGAVVSGQNIAATSTAPPDIIDVPAGVSVTLKNLSIRVADHAGTAVDDAGTVSIEGSELSQNNSSSAIVVEQGAKLAVLNSTISDNSGIGADIFGDATFTNSTIAHNQAAGLFNEQGSTTLVNTIVAGNGNGAIGSTDCVGKATTTTSSLDADGSCGANLHGDPRLGPLAWNGGPTMTRSLEAGSPAIGAGSTCPATDQRLAPRSSCDLGAFAYGSNSPATSVPGDKPPIAPPPPQAPGSGTPPSGGGGGSPPPNKPPAGQPKPTSPSKGGKPGKSIVIVSVRGAMNGVHGVRIHLQAITGAQFATFTYDDVGAGIHLRKATVQTFHFNKRLMLATLTGRTFDKGHKRSVAFTIVVGTGGHARFHIALSTGYRKRGTVPGRIAITA